MKLLQFYGLQLFSLITLKSRKSKKKYVSVSFESIVFISLNGLILMKEVRISLNQLQTLEVHPQNSIYSLIWSFLETDKQHSGDFYD